MWRLMPCITALTVGGGSFYPMDLVLGGAVTVPFYVNAPLAKRFNGGHGIFRDHAPMCYTLRSNLAF